MTRQGGVTVTSNSKQLKKIIEKQAKQKDENIVNALNAGAILVHNTAVKSVESHQSQGATYGNHTASAAGNPPNADTGHLNSNILITQTASKDDMHAVVVSRAPYSMALEHGTKDIEPRPFMAPALAEHKAAITALVKKALGS